MTADGEARKAGSCLPIAEAGQNVAANVERLRQARRLSLRDLSAHLAEHGRPILPSVLHALLQGKRRTDADDLVALAAVLGVTPDVLLSSPEAVRAGPAAVPPALREARNLVSRIEDLLEAAGDPAAREFAGGYVDRALLRVQIEVEELIAEARRTRDPGRLHA